MSDFQADLRRSKARKKHRKQNPKSKKKELKNEPTNENKDEHIVHFYSLNISDIHRRKRTLIKSEIKREKRQIAGQ